MDRDDARSLALPTALLLLGAASAAFDVGCVLIKTPFLRPGVTLGDLIETAGVFVVLALFARVGRLAAGGIASGAALLTGFAAAAFALGHGAHVAANSIHDLAERSGAGDPTGLLDFWDERVGHYAVDSGRILFAVALLGQPAPSGEGPLAAARGGRASSESGPTTRRLLPALLVALGGAAYGFTTFASAVEGQTVPLVLPFYALAAVAVVVLARAGRGQPWIRFFFGSAAGTALLFFLIWGIWQHGFPEFTRAGIIHGAGGPG
ncbi:MAG TPA: hypothetical protein VFM00_03800 [Candidatus Eisenbacteria bacterium]|nr:hypothetical protein [Candidatus Eisenbacteria bacterium]